jgi:hypothetical protein
MNDDVSNIEKLPQPLRLAANSTTPMCLDRTIQPCRSHLAVKRKVEHKVERKSGSPGRQRAPQPWAFCTQRSKAKQAKKRRGS